MTTHWGLPSPNLVVSVVGGGGGEKIKPWVKDVLRNGLVRAAQSTGMDPFHSDRDEKKILYACVFGILYDFSLFSAFTCPGAWILTGGLREGVAHCVGEAVRDHGAAAPALSQKKVIAVGVTPWGLVHNRQQLVNAQVVQTVNNQSAL